MAEPYFPEREEDPVIDRATGLTWVRKWILHQIKSILPSENSEVRSDNNANNFTEWTGTTQSYLESQWIKEDTQRALNYMAQNNGIMPPRTLMRYQQGADFALKRAKDIAEGRKKEYEDAAKLLTGSQPFSWSSLKGIITTTTTCNLFLGNLVRKALLAGKLENRNFPSFDLPKAGGAAWHYYPGKKNAQAGDFYELGKKVKIGRNGVAYEYQHVGIIFSIKDGIWETADSGQGGPGSGFDKIKRGKRTGADGVLGFIDVDEYFKGWNGPRIYED